ncbi:hypothetical protein M434DRAFT_31698 [Hypoxylon sp. CO27-5]|nr:hypothetical protein M434DRAFT_31698 [Hypoxylon sp. CO27-5]
MARIRDFLAKTIMVFSLAGLISAASNVTVVPLPSGCAGYPNYDNATGIAGPLRLLADSTGREQDGFKFIPKFAIAVGGGSWGFMVIPATENKTAEANEVVFRCGNDTLQAQLDLGYAGTRWQPLIAAGTPDSHVVEGVTQPGVFLGAVNVTTWGFNYQNFTETGEYYFLRLLGPNSQNRATGKPLNPGEFTGYIKITGL